MKQFVRFDRIQWIVCGFIFGASISLFVCSGVFSLLSIIQKLELPEQEVLILTVLFYGIVFFIAHSGVRTGTRQNKALLSGKSIKDFSKIQTEMKSATARVKTVLWNAVTVVSVAWLTPALIIYWASLQQPGVAVAACCFLFSLAGAILYIFKSGAKKKTVYSRLQFFMGLCVGVLAVVCFLPGM